MDSLRKISHFEHILCYYSIFYIDAFLEIVLSSKAARGFESIPLRQITGKSLERFAGLF